MAQSAASEPGATTRSLESAHKALLANRDLQFTFDEAPRRVVRKARHPFQDFFDWLGGVLSAAEPILRVLLWGAVAAAVVAILYLIAREAGLLEWTRRKKAPKPTPRQYQPKAELAQALLADADALAAEGRYEEAVHVLLLRSVEDIRRWRPRSVEPSFTSRDLAVHPILPPPARTAFSDMARLVETSLFGGRKIGAEGFAESRRAYEAFALPGVWA